MKFLGCCHFLLLFIPFASLKTFSSSSSSEPSSGFQETFEKCCPPGLWCGKKRHLTEEETRASQYDEQQQPDGKIFDGNLAARTKTQFKDPNEQRKQQVNVFEKRCPPGLWCGRKREVKDLSSSNSTERVNVDNVADQFEKRCPPGLWCGKKRESSDQNLNNFPLTEDINKQSRIKTFEKRCPPGLWCGKKREVAHVVSNRKSTETGDVNNMAGRFEKRCPPGLWCGKKREVSDQNLKKAEQTEDMNEKTRIKSFEKRCPPGLWCGKKREVADVVSNRKSAETGDVNNMAGRFEKRCPPGLWCGKKREVSDQNLKKAEQTEDMNAKTRIKSFEKRCPPGLWCGK